MYSSGLKKKEIARELGVTPPAIGNWSKRDRWDERLAQLVSRADEAINSAGVNKVAGALAYLHDQVATRVKELEALCGGSQSATTRLAAIKLWLTLAGVNRALPNPTDPTTPKSLELIEDILHELPTSDKLSGRSPDNSDEGIQPLGLRASITSVSTANATVSDMREMPDVREPV